MIRMEKQQLWDLPRATSFKQKSHRFVEAGPFDSFCSLNSSEGDRFFASSDLTSSFDVVGGGVGVDEDSAAAEGNGVGGGVNGGVNGGVDGGVVTRIVSFLVVYACWWLC